MTSPGRVAHAAVSSLRRLPVIDVGAAFLLSVFVVLLTSGVTNHTSGVGVPAALLALTMTVPVAWRRPAPLGAAACLAAGALLNAALIGDLVRCGAGLPAVFAVAYAVGLDDRDEGSQPWRVGGGLALCALNIVTQSISDPQLGFGVAWYMVAIALAFAGLGRVARSWNRAAGALRRTTAELEEQRSETARVAVAADRARLSQELEAVLSGRLDGLALEARRGVDAGGSDLSEARSQLQVIEAESRRLLDEMRGLVASLDPGVPS
jgi:signal transduction histidine kinase